MSVSLFRPIPAFVIGLICLGGCAVHDVRHGLPVVEETWISIPVDEQVDSVSTWQTPEGKVLLLATAKASDTLRFYDADTGRHLRSQGRSGSGDGEFARPNGIVVIDDLAFVVERDNHRVQVIELTSSRSLGSFGDDDLRVPYGLWVWPQGDDRYQVYVTDSYYTPDDRVPPDAELGERVKRFDVVVGAAGAVSSTLVSRFGATSGDGRLKTVESIWGDPAHGRVLVADENASALDVKVYDMDGRFTGTVIGHGLFHREPEGIALVECGDAADGYWIVSDQHPVHQMFHLFDRRSLAHVGSFAPATAHTVDGIWFQRGAFGPFRQGALFSQHADSATLALDWKAIAAAVGLRDDCAL